MFKALTDMMRTPVVIRPCIGVDTVGDKTYGSDINTMCCVEPRVTVLPTVKTGVQEISEGLLYISGDVEIGSNDLVIFDGRQYTVKRLWADYEGPNVSLWVVYF
jgi:hypothetical protein